MSDAPDFIWTKTTLGNTDEGYWNDCPIVPNMPENQGVPYVRRDPAVLAELPEVKAMIAAAVMDVARPAMATYAAAVLEASDAETDDEAREIAASWFSHWMRMGYPSEGDTDPESGPRARRMLSDVDHALKGFPLIRPDAKAALEAHVAAEVRKALEAAAKEDDNFFGLVVDGMAEADRAMKKFPQPNYVISKVAEEAGEVVKAAIHCAEGRETAENVRGEMRQLIAMLYRLWVEGDQVHGLAAIRALIPKVKP